MEALTEEEKRALRGSKFAPLPTVAPPSKTQPRLAHPAGPMKTNKAAALAKFLERRMQDSNGLASVDPRLIELAVKNAKDTLNAGESSKSGRIVHHVDSFDDTEESAEEEVKMPVPKKKTKKKPKKKDKKKSKKRMNLEDSTNGKSKKSKKKMKL